MSASPDIWPPLPLPGPPSRLPAAAVAVPLARPAAGDGPLAADRLVETDGELLRLFTRHGETAAFDKLVERHSAMVWRVCRQSLRRRQDAEDAFQATFLLLVKSARQIGASESAAGWLFRVAYRTSLRARKRLASRREEALALDPTAPSEIPFPDLTARQHMGVLAEELMELPLRYQTPLVMRYIEGQSRRAIAEATDVTVATVQGRLARGKQLLRRRLVRRGVSLSVAVGVLSSNPRAEAAAPSTHLLLQTTTSAVSLATGGTLAASTAVVLLLEQGTRAMLFASLTKPMAAAAACGLAALVLAAPPVETTTTTASEGVVLSASVAGDDADEPTATLQLVANEPASDREPEALAPGVAAQQLSEPTKASFYVNDLMEGDRNRDDATLSEIANEVTRTHGIEPARIQVHNDDQTITVVATKQQIAAVTDHIDALVLAKKNVAVARARSRLDAFAEKIRSKLTSVASDDPNGEAKKLQAALEIALNAKTELEAKLQNEAHNLKPLYDIALIARAQVQPKLPNGEEPRKDNSSQEGLYPILREFFADYTGGKPLEVKSDVVAAENPSSAPGVAAADESSDDSALLKALIEDEAGPRLTRDAALELIRLTKADQLGLSLGQAQSAARIFASLRDNTALQPGQSGIKRDALLFRTAAGNAWTNPDIKPSEAQRKPLDSQASQDLIAAIADNAKQMHERAEAAKAKGDTKAYQDAIEIARRSDDEVRRRQQMLVESSGEPEASATGVAAASEPPQVTAKLQATSESHAVTATLQQADPSLDLRFGDMALNGRKLSDAEQNEELRKQWAEAAKKDPPPSDGEPSFKELHTWHTYWEHQYDALRSQLRAMTEANERTPGAVPEKEVQTVGADIFKARAEALRYERELKLRALKDGESGASAPPGVLFSPTVTASVKESALSTLRLPSGQRIVATTSPDPEAPGSRVRLDVRVESRSENQPARQGEPGASAIGGDAGASNQSQQPLGEAYFNAPPLFAPRTNAPTPSPDPLLEWKAMTVRWLMNPSVYGLSRDDAEWFRDEVMPNREESLRATIKINPYADATEIWEAWVDRKPADKEREVRVIAAMIRNREAGGGTAGSSSSGARVPASALLDEPAVPPSVKFREVAPQRVAAFEAVRVPAPPAEVVGSGSLRAELVPSTAAAAAEQAAQAAAGVKEQLAAIEQSASVVREWAPGDDQSRQMITQLENAVAQMKGQLKEMQVQETRAKDVLREVPVPLPAKIEFRTSELAPALQELETLRQQNEMLRAELDAMRQQIEKSSFAFADSRVQWQGPTGATPAQPFVALLPLDKSGRPGKYAGANQQYGFSVQQLQQRLNEVLSPSPNLDIDGDYGPQTVAAVKRLQTERGLRPSGVADEPTRRAMGLLEVAPAPQATHSYGSGTYSNPAAPAAPAAKSIPAAWPEFPKAPPVPAVPSIPAAKSIPAELAPPAAKGWGGGGAPSGSPRTSESTPPPTGASLTGAPPPPSETTGIALRAPKPDGARIKYAKRNSEYGWSVLQLQERLNEVLKPTTPLRVDGDYGPLTEAAVKEFQKVRELPVTGDVDERTREALGFVEPEVKSHVTPKTIEPSSLPKERVEALRSEINKNLDEAEESLRKLVEVAKQADGVRKTMLTSGDAKVWESARAAFVKEAAKHLKLVFRKTDAANSVINEVSYGALWIDDPGSITKESKLTEEATEFVPHLERLELINHYTNAAYQSLVDAAVAKNQYSFDIEEFDPEKLVDWASSRVRREGAKESVVSIGEKK